MFVLSTARKSEIDDALHSFIHVCDVSDAEMYAYKAFNSTNDTGAGRCEWIESTRPALNKRRKGKA